MKTRVHHCAACALLTIMVGSGVVRADEPGSLPANPRFVFQQVGGGSELATKLVATMVKDHDGFLWFGTLTGLFRYDGVAVEQFGKEQGLPRPYIEQLVVGPDGTLWASTHAGVMCFNGLFFEQFLTGIEDEFLLRKDVVQQRLALSDDNHVYMVSNKGLLEFDGQTRKLLRTWSTEDGLPKNRTTAVTVAPDGLVWFACEGSVVTLRPDTGKIEVFSKSEGVPEENTTALLVNSSGTVWLRSQHHLMKKPAGASRFIHDDEGIPPRTVGWGAFSLDRDGNPLVPSTEGLFYKADGQWRSITEKQGLTSDWVLCALEDDSGALWIGQGGAGVTRWPGRRTWSAWTTAEGIPDNVVWSTLVDRRGRTWVATNDGVGIWDPGEGRWQIRREEDGVVGSLITKLVEGPQGCVWAVAPTIGMTRFNPETLEATKVPMPEECVKKRNRITTAPNGDIWISCNWFLLSARIDNGQVSFERQEVPGEIKKCLRKMKIAPDGVMWTTGPEGIGRFDGKEWRRFSKADGLKLDYADEMAAISGNEVWFGYYNFEGLTRLLLDNDGRPSTTHFGAKEGLPSDTVYMVTSDTVGNIWAGGNAGLGRISRSDLSIRIFNHNDGLIWDDLSANSSMAGPDGSFFMGTSRGLVHYRPEADEKVEKPPNVVITSATLGGTQVMITPRPFVDHDDGTFWVKFSGLTFTRPISARFKYRLVGLENNFVETGLREARYPSLPGGSYRFEVYCVSATGIESPRPAVYDFVVRPPWWETLWFRMFLFFVAMLVFFIGVGLRTRKLKKDRSRLEKAVAERSAELAQANARLKDLSFTDALTSARNRRYFSEFVSQDLPRIVRKFRDKTPGESRSDASAVVYMIDLDFFKQVNDRYGHSAGDRILVEFTDRLRAMVRQSDLIVRWGGEEFLLLLRDTERDQANVQAGRILSSIGMRNFQVDDSTAIRLTCSLGWAPFPFYEGASGRVSMESVIELADRGLYMAKQTGRNRSVGVMPTSAVPLRDVSSKTKSGDTTSIMPPEIDAPLSEIDGHTVDLLKTAGPGPPSFPPQ